ncbi:hypothetical protein MSG28_008608 [Choristoneura fumiferana]|uniref:Uncharacterized protein n=1 Tax=Choristoneura fumiferana TaxID=7141 RepID=A0ACC0J7D2_CHOFU|nr:hypothetical protein MSG28_008608 [Choristoneura fumiferana]
MSVSGTSTECACTAPSEDSSPPLTPACQCPRDDHDIVVHDEMCLLYKNETMIYQEPGECDCCLCPLDKCRCMKAGREAFDEWRGKRDMGALPAVLESTHPLMQKFQATLKHFLEKENAIAEEEILNLRDELRLSKLGYEKDLETIYRDDHDTNAQRDMVIYGLSNEVWKLESKLEMFKKQFEIKNNEMEKINDKVTAYSTELEDLELDKRRLVSLWNSVLVNIQQRDKVFDSVREDYNNLAITKKVVMEEMNRSKEIAMNKDKIIYDINSVAKLFDAEDAKRIAIETQIAELTESIEMTERDQNLIKMVIRNQTIMNLLSSTEKDFDRKTEQRLKLENEILQNIQECLLNDKAVESMANGIKKMREISRKQELALAAMENTHAQVMLDIEVYRNQQAKNNILLEANQAKVRAREKEIDELQEKYDQRVLELMRKQRELDIVTKKNVALKEIFDVSY